jgi:hypothetical protein
MDTARRDSGSVVIGWLTKLIVVVAVIGVMLFDVLSVTAARIGTSDDANQAATIAGNEWRTSHNAQLAYEAALDSLPSDSEDIPARSFVIGSDGSVHLVVKRPVKTMLAHRIGPFKKYSVVTAHGEAAAPAP